MSRAPVRRVRFLVAAVPSWQDEAVDPVGDELASHLHAAYDADGVDRSLIRASLARTPEERLAELEAALTFFESATARRASTDDPVSRDPEDAR